MTPQSATESQEVNRRKADEVFAEDGGDIDGLAEAIRRESTDVTPPTPSGTDT